MTDEKIFIVLINQTLRQMCTVMDMPDVETKKLMSSFWQIYIYKTADEMSKKSNDFVSEQYLLHDKISEEDIKKLAPIIKEKYLDSSTNIGYMLDVLTEFVKLFIKNIRNVTKRNRVIDLTIGNFQYDS